VKENGLSGSRSRRSFVKQILSLAGAPVLTSLSSSLLVGQASRSTAQPRSAAKPAFSQQDDQLLDDMERLSSCFFWEQTNPDVGLIKDRCNARDPASDKNTVASIAATGFGLTALCIAVKRGYLFKDEVRPRVLTTLRFLADQLPNHRGFFYHWADMNTGERVWDSEVSSVDTALLLCGVLTCREFFRDEDITRLANTINERIDWTWLSEDTSLLPHGWLPEVGFLPYRWDYYSELMMMYLLAIGSPTHPLPAETWDAWKRVRFNYEGMRYIGSFAPLFVHQYSQAWFDFRGKSDGYADYFYNSITATKVHMQFCLELGKQFPDYSEDLWGITASDSQKGYVIWGGPPMMGPIDGTVVPSAAAGSLPFLPAESMRVLRTIRNKYPNAWTNYAFVNAFNPLTNWYDTDVVGIDTGISMLMAENARSAFVWNTFMQSPEAKRGMARAGFHGY
jgi:hypothetical protein